MKDNKRIFTLFGTYAAILMLASIVGITLMLSKKPEESPSVSETLTQTQLVYVWAEEPTDTSAVTEPPQRQWTVREYEQVIGVFDEEGKLVYTLDVYVKTLPQTDRNLLREGICVTSEKQLRELIEDYSS